MLRDGKSESGEGQKRGIEQKKEESKTGAERGERERREREREII